MKNKLSPQDAAELMLISARIRRSALEMVYNATSGHLGGSFSICELLAVLYFHEMHIDPASPADPDRDRFVLSKGHCTPALYSALAFRGYFPLEEPKSFRRLDGHMSGHAEMHHVKGVDMSTGSLGQGISAAVGMALAGKLDSKDYRTYAILGDGEIQEGQVWEAAMAAGNYGLDNLCASWTTISRSTAPLRRSCRPIPSTVSLKILAGTLSTAMAMIPRTLPRPLTPPGPARESPLCSSPTRSKARACPLWKTPPNGTATIPIRNSIFVPLLNWMNWS